MKVFLIFYHLNRCYYEFLDDIFHQAKQIIIIILLKVLRSTCLLLNIRLYVTFLREVDYIEKCYLYNSCPSNGNSLYWINPPTYKKRKLWVFKITLWRHWGTPKVLHKLSDINPWKMGKAISEHYINMAFHYGTLQSARRETQR